MGRHVGRHLLEGAHHGNELVWHLRVEGRQLFPTTDHHCRVSQRLYRFGQLAPRRGRQSGGGREPDEDHQDQPKEDVLLVVRKARFIDQTRSGKNQRLPGQAGEGPIRYSRSPPPDVAIRRRLTLEAAPENDLLEHIGEQVWFDETQFGQHSGARV